MTLSLGRQIYIQHEVGPMVQSEIEHIFVNVIKEVKFLYIKQMPPILYIGNLE